MATAEQDRMGRAWRCWLYKRPDSFPDARIRTVVGILRQSDCVYEVGMGHGPAAFANFAAHRAGLTQLAGKNVDQATATGIRKEAAVKALLAKHGEQNIITTAT
jgi:hypothetical protein